MWFKSLRCAYDSLLFLNVGQSKSWFDIENWEFMIRIRIYNNIIYINEFIIINYKSILKFTRHKKYSINKIGSEWKWLVRIWTEITLLQKNI